MTDQGDAELGGLAPGHEAAELMLGIQFGTDPRPALAVASENGVVITQSSSPWNRTRCLTCGHTFRRGDRVLVAAVTRVVQHLVPGIECGTDPDPGQDMTTAGRDELSAGLLATWPTSVPISRLAADDWRIPRPGQPKRDQSPICLYCGHTFRSGEYVVICPCTPESQLCGAAVHRDPVAGLPCWDRWQPEGELTVCPTTLVRL